MHGLGFAQLLFLLLQGLAFLQLFLHLLAEVSTGVQEGVGLHQLAVLNVIRHLAVELVQLVVVQFGVALGHVGDELLVVLLVLVEFLQRFLVFLQRDFVFFLQGLNLVLLVLQLFLQVAAYLALGVQLVLQLLLGGLHDDVERVGGGLVGFPHGVHVHQLVAFLPYRVHAEHALGDGEGEGSVVGVHQHGGAPFDGDGGPFQALAGHQFAVHHAAFGLHVALLGLGKRPCPDKQY